MSVAREALDGERFEWTVRGYCQTRADVSPRIEGPGFAARGAPANAPATDSQNVFEASSISLPRGGDTIREIGAPLPRKGVPYGCKHAVASPAQISQLLSAAAKLMQNKMHPSAEGSRRTRRNNLRVRSERSRRPAPMLLLRSVCCCALRNSLVCDRFGARNTFRQARNHGYQG